MYDEKGYVLSHANRPAINPDFNPDFNPDYSCLFDTFQLKCVPGSGQECPSPQFASAEPQTCWSKTFINGEWVRNCPDGYHSTEGDETGQCYPNSEGCKEAALLNKEGDRFEYILLTGDDSPDPYDRCAHPEYLCYYNGGSNPDHSGCEEYRKWRSADN